MTGASSRFIFLLTNPISLLRHRPSTFFRLLRHRPLTTLTAAHNHHFRHSHHNSLIPIKFSQNYWCRATNYSLQDNNHVPANERHVSPSHPWPEWSRLVESLYNAGYFNRNFNVEDDFMVNENLSMEFVDAANSCLTFARHRPDILCWLPRRDIKMLIDDGYPFLFKSAGEIEIRMKSFLQVEGSNDATSVDLMKYILSYVSNFIVYPERNVKEATESCVRRLLQEMANVSYMGRVSEQHEQMPRNLGPNITMKRGDWICAKCNFMNFARNAKCLECEELRPQRQLTDGEWDCPRCNFFNFRKNVVCLKCGCRRSDEAQLPGQTDLPSGQTHNNDKEDKIEGWFKKVKELHGIAGQKSDISHDELPIRKEEDHFVDNKMKDQQFSSYQRQHYMEQGSTSSFAPLVPFPPETQQMRSTSNLDSRSYVGNRTIFNGETNTDSYSNQFRRNEPKPKEEDHFVDNKMKDQQFSSYQRQHSMEPGSTTSFAPFVPFPPETQQMRSTINLDSRSYVGNRTIFNGETNTDSYGNQFRRNEPKPKEEDHFVDNKMKGQQFSSYQRQHSMEQGSTSSFAPFVPFPPDYFAKKDYPKNTDSTVKPANEVSYSNNATVSKNLVKETETQHMRSTSNLDSRSYVGNRTIFDGETNTDSYGNQFRRNESKPEGNRTLFSGDTNTSSSGNQFTRHEPKPEGNRTLYSGDRITNSSSNQEGNRTLYSGGVNTNLSSYQLRRNEPEPEGNRTLYSGDMNTDSSSNEFRRNEPRPVVSQKTPESMNVRSGWTGKSLEGSAVTEPDPLDMSEKAKAERWFRRVAQIKDISELTQIPDEDFPSIMPMRKGVNRFVVSKRKTPLERRLTSPQYRKNEL